MLSANQHGEIFACILLIKLLLKQNLEMKKLSTKRNIIQPPTEFRDKPIPAPRKSVKQMVQDYEDNIIQPPLDFRDDYKPVPSPRTEKPVPFSHVQYTGIVTIR